MLPTISPRTEHFLVLPDSTAIPVPQPRGQATHDFPTDSITINGRSAHSPQEWASAQAAYLNAEQHLGLVDYAKLDQMVTHETSQHPATRALREPYIERGVQLIQNTKLANRQNAGKARTPEMLRILAQAMSASANERNTSHILPPHMPVLIEFRQR